MTAIWQQINDQAAETVGQVQAGLVQIIGDDGGIGAGVIWREDGLIVTNAHVVLAPHRGTLYIQLADNRRYQAAILATDPQRDLALVKIAADNLPTIQSGASSDLQVGEWLMALGHPWGVQDALTAGIVIGKGSDLPEVGDGREWLALDMQMRPGHSGGALFNSFGHLIGINTMIRGPEVSFAVPVDTVKAFVEEALATAAQPQQEQPMVV